MIFLVILLVLAIGGRWACSRICPLGIIEELIFKIPVFKKYRELPGEKHLKKIKYEIFLLLLILVPSIFMPNREQWRGAFLSVKLFGFSTVFLLSLFVYRPFCKYFCPFGVFLGLFNKISPYQYKLDSTCNGCGLCKRTCKMGIVPYTDPNHMECIRCGDCLRHCPRKALHPKIKRKGPHNE